MRKDLTAELQTLEFMIGLYCRGRHGGPKLCRACGELLAYSRERLERCPRDPKPACRACPAHCYSPERRAQIRAVMRYAGPRMLLRRPLLALKHYLGR